MNINMNTKKTPSSGIIKKQRLLGAAFAAPAALLVLFATIIPVAWNIVLSFSNWSIIGENSFAGLTHYMEVFANKAALKTVWQSITISLVASVTAMILGTCLAIMIYRVSRLEGAFFRFLFYGPGMLPMTVVGLLFTFVLATDEGLVNNFLKLVGLANLTSPWLAEKGTVLIVIGLVQGWRSSGTIMMLIYTAILGIPESLRESAHLDGASFITQVRRIILPLIRSTIQMAFSFMVMWAFKTYDIVWSMTGGGPGDLSKTTPILIVEQAFKFNKFGYASALSLVYAALIIFVIIIIRKGLGGETYEY
ncbi:MAG TPA: sugar ABC transporter permease [Clostridiales bacterium]|nr:sugar ABC transporter permease [Clostridiales bacterium]